MRIDEDDVMDLVVAVYMNDKTSYAYGECRGSDERKPKSGERWATPREIAKAFMKKYRITFSGSVKESESE